MFRQVVIGFLAATWAGCASAPPAVSELRRVLSFDDNQVDGAIAFPNNHYESVVRFELPAGTHRPLRLWIQAASAGTIGWTIYDQNALESPGDVLLARQRQIGSREVADGKNGLWLVEDLGALGKREGVLWIGIKKITGEPTIAASRFDSRQYYVRSNDPTAPLDLLPVKRTPMVRIELAASRD